MKEMGKYVWGFILIILGLILLGKSFGLYDFNIFFKGWWTLFIIVPSVIGLFNEKDKTGNSIGLIIGLFLLLACQNIISFRDVWKLILPVVLVVVGLSILFKDILNSKVKNQISKLNKSKSDKAYCSTFSSQKIDLEKEVFTGCDLESVFGGIELDLRDCVIKKDVVINTNAVFGGITIFVPKNVNVKVSSNSLFGGVDNHHSNSKEEKTKTIFVNASCIFGGVEIK